MTASQVFRNALIVLLTLVLAYAVYQSLHILVVLVIALIIASSVRPLVMWFVRRGIGIGWSALLVYLLLGISLFVLSAAIVPPITQQLASYVASNNADSSTTTNSGAVVPIGNTDGSNPTLAEKLITTQNWVEKTLSGITGSTVKLFDPDQIRKTTTDVISQISASLPALAGAFGSLLGDFILVIVIGIYWLTSRDQALNFVMQLFAMGKHPMVETISTEVEQSVGNYTRGVILVATFVGVANFIILRLFQVPNAITLGFIMGITTILPLIGGYLGAGLSTLLALLSSPVYALIAFGSFVAVQQIENHILTPRVMSRSVGLNPILIIICLFIGSDLGGVIGALIAVPVAGTIMILLRHLVIEPRKQESLPQFIQGGVLIEGNNADKTLPPESVVLVAH
jgi:predicted PurR-regulated permease PerM